jgi:hypothetical protein
LEMSTSEKTAMTANTTFSAVMAFPLPRAAWRG